MLWDKNKLNELPQMLSLDKVSKFCHISKLTTRYYLKSGLLKNTDTGKKTRCYQISKTDLIIFLKEYEENPEKFEIPENWYSTQGHILTITRTVFGHSKTTLEAIYNYSKKVYFEELLKGYPEALTFKEIEEITGYKRSAIKKWYNQKHLRYLTTEPRLVVPRKYMLEFLTSDYFNYLMVRSTRNMNHLKNIEKVAEKYIVLKEN